MKKRPIPGPWAAHPGRLTLLIYKTFSRLMLEGIPFEPIARWGRSESL
jgi:hypothetical protein